MVNSNAKLGQILKEARLTAKLTREDLFEMTGLSVRYIAAIENEGKKPRFDILFTIVRTLGIDANTIFYPKDNDQPNEKQQIIRMIDLCDEHNFNIVSAVVKAVLKK